MWCFSTLTKRDDFKFQLDRKQLMKVFIDGKRLLRNVNLLPRAVATNTVENSKNSPMGSFSPRALSGVHASSVDTTCASARWCSPVAAVGVVRYPNGGDHAGAHRAADQRHPEAHVVVAEEVDRHGGVQARRLLRHDDVGCNSLAWRDS